MQRKPKSGKETITRYRYFSKDILLQYSAYQRNR